MIKKLNKKGFAMVETLIVAVSTVAILSIIFTLVYPLLGNYDASANYEDVDTKYIAFYVKEMIETDSTNPNPIVKTPLDLCGGKCKWFGTTAKKCKLKVGGTNGECEVDSNGVIQYENVDTLFTESSDSLDVHYLYQNALCDRLDNSKYTKNNQYACNRYIESANITNMFLINYDTRAFKNYVKDHDTIAGYKISRNLKEYVAYMPTHHANTSKNNDYYLLIVEVQHDSYNTFHDTYYTYASIEVKK